MKKNLINILLLIFLAVFFLLFYFKLTTSGYLTFSDGAKFAEVARNIHKGLGYGSKFTFFNLPPLQFIGNKLFSAKGALVGMPLAISFSYKLFGVNDFAVIFVSGFFYVGLVVATYLLGKSIYGNKAGVVAAIAVAANENFLDYATSGASEVMFAFIVVIAFYFISLKKNKYNMVALLALFLSYFIRPQAFLYIIAGVCYWLFLNFDNMRALTYFVLVLVAGYLTDRFLPKLLSGFPYYYSISGIAKYSVTQHLPGESVSGVLRQTSTITTSVINIVKKYLYNIYNFYRLLPKILSPYFMGLFVVGLFKISKKKKKALFKIVVLLMFALVFSATALSIPFFRYLHPVVPFIYIVAATTIVWIAEKISESSIKTINNITIKNMIFRKMNRQSFLNVILVSVLIFYVVGQALGGIFLDSRYRADITNKGKPPVYVALSNILKENTNPDDVVITNLDTWGSWYGDRRTVWFPLRPNQLIIETDNKVPLDAIYLTDYLINDENYYMGDEWRQIFYDPENPENEFIAENYELKEIFEIEGKDVYEKQDARAVLFIKKEVSKF